MTPSRLLAALMVVGTGVAAAAGRPHARPGVEGGGGWDVPPIPSDAGPAMPNIAYLTVVAGLPADSLEARAFLGGFFEAFDDDHYLPERPASELPPASPVLNSRFRLVRGDRFGDEWQVSLTVLEWLAGAQDTLGRADAASGRAEDGAAPVAGSSPIAARSRARQAQPPVRGLRVAVAALSPAAAALGAQPAPVREDLLLDFQYETRAAWFAHAGRLAGLLAVEALHLQSGDLPAGVRLRLPGARRTPAGGGDPPSPRR